MRFSLITVALAAVLLLALLAGCEREVIVEQVTGFELSSCFTCHSDQDMDLVQAREQFEYSIHGSGENVDRNRLYQASYQGCEKCHTSEGFVAAVTGIPADGDAFTPISCFTCHAPHTEGNLSLRVNDAVNLADGTVFDRGKANLCASCHQSRRNVTTTVVDGVTLNSHWGPHYSNQADMLIGENSYEYANYTYTKSAHAAVADDGCVMCHMGDSRHPSIAGHSWNMRNEDRDFEAIAGCNVSGCHQVTPITDLDRTADGDYDWDGTVEGIQSEVHGLLDSLHVVLEAANLLDAEGHPVSRSVATADSAGAVYNFLFVEEDRSVGVHNTDYAVGLLRSSINFIVHGNPNGMVAPQAAVMRETLSAH